MVYEMCRLWVLSTDLIEGIRHLILDVVLGNAGNAQKCLAFIDAIERTSFRKLHSLW